MARSRRFACAWVLPQVRSRTRSQFLKHGWLDQRLAVLARTHNLDESLKSGGIPDACGDPGAVEMGCKADTVFADIFEDVLDVIDQLGGCVRVGAAIRTKKARSEVDPNEAARFADGRQLLVREISRMRAQSMRVGVRRDQGRIADSGDVPKSAFVEM